MKELHKTIRVSNVAACPVVFILFYDRDGQGGVFKGVKNEKIFSHLGPFPDVFGQVSELLILELHENMRVLHAVVPPIDFNLLRDVGQQLGVLKMLLF